MKQCSYCISNLIIDKLLMVLKHLQFDQNVELAVGKQRLPVLNRSHLYSFRTNASAQNQIALFLFARIYKRLSVSVLFQQKTQ